MNNIIVGNSVSYSAALDVRYNNEIIRFIRPYLNDIGIKVLEILSVDRGDISALFSKMIRIQRNRIEDEGTPLALILSASMLARVNGIMNAQARNALEPIFGDKVNKLSKKLNQKDSKKITGMMSGFIIKIILNYLSSVESYGLKQIAMATAGKLSGAKDNVKKFIKSKRNSISKIVKREAARSIRDIQVLVLIAKFSLYGIKSFMWDYSGAHRDKPRIYHKEVLNGKVFPIAKPPIIDENTGEKGFPAQLFGCLCKLKPVYIV